MKNVYSLLLLLLVIFMPAAVLQASYTATEVVNAYTNAPAPTDTDSDGIPDAEENMVTNPDGLGTGDGNGDGTADYLQPHVVSLASLVLSKSGAIQYFTIEAPSNTLFENVASIALPEALDAVQAKRFPLGMVTFKLSGISIDNCTPADIHFYIPSAMPAFGFVQQNQYDQFWNCNTPADKVILENKLVISFSLIDDWAYDMDINAGVIQSSGALVSLAMITNFAGEESATMDVFEHQQVLTTMEAFDPFSSTFTYSIFGGEDADLFVIGSSTGVLAFSEIPDYEIAGDDNADSVYHVTIRAIASNGTEDYQDLSITLKDRNDRPVANTPQTGIAMLRSIMQAATAEDAVNILMNPGDDLLGMGYESVPTLDVWSLFVDEDFSLDEFAGIVISANNANPSSEGKWQYCTDPGRAEWFDIGTVSTDQALLLDQNAYLRFVPIPNFSGRPGGLVIHLIDNSGSTVNPTPLVLGGTAPTNAADKKYYYGLPADEPSSSVAIDGIDVNIDVLPNCDVVLGSTTAINHDAGSVGIGTSPMTITVAGTGGSDPCRSIALIAPAGGSTAVSGTVVAKVSVFSQLPTNAGFAYLPRSVEITPDENASTATATITLYYTQSDFDVYNAAANGDDFPYDGADQEGLKANIRIYKYSGVSSDGSGLPASYTQTGKLIIDPDDDDIVWNATMNRWEISFDITGFSGFFAGTLGGQLLPITLKSFTGKNTPSGNALSWTTVSEIQAKAMLLERSTNGMDFSTIATIAANGKPSVYNYTDSKAIGTAYYRLKLMSKDATYSYSQIVKLQSVNRTMRMTLYPNPAQQTVQINSEAQTGIMKVYNIQGAVMMQQIWKPGEAINISKLPAGSYIVELQSSKGNEREKLIKN